MMKTKHELMRAYPDLLGEATDPDLLRVIADLDTAYTAPEPPAHLETTLALALANRRRNRQAVRKRAPGVLRFVLRMHRLGVVAAALLAAVLLAGGAYAITSLIGQVMRLEPGTAHVEVADLGRKLDLVQTMNGVTVKIERAYADVNRIIVGYTIEAPPDLANDHGGFGANLVLTDSSGRTYPSRVGMGRREPGAQVGGDVMSFDAEGLPPGTSAMTFTLTIPEVTASRVGGPQPTAIRPDPGSTPNARPVAPLGGAEVRVAGPWRFSFNLPVLPGRVAHVNQTVTAAGIPMTLERVVVSPTETRAYMRFPPPGDLPAEQWQPMANVAVSGWDSRTLQLGPGTSGPPIDGRHRVSVPASLHDQHGTWTLTIDELLGMPKDATIGPDGGLEIIRIAGPWIFTFVVP